MGTGGTAGTGGGGGGWRYLTVPGLGILTQHGPLHCVSQPRPSVSYRKRNLAGEITASIRALRRRDETIKFNVYN